MSETFLGALLIGCVASLLIALTAALTGSVPPSGALALTGLFFPVVLVVSFAAVGWSLAVHGRSRMRLRLVLESSKRRYRLLLAGPFLLLAWAVLSQIGFYFFSRWDGRPRLAALIVTALSLVLLLQGSFVLEELSTALSRRFPRPPLLVAALASVFLLFGGGTLLAFAGETSGVGGPLALYGVLRREEIIWAPVRELVTLTLSAYLGGLFARRLVPPVVSWFLGGLIAFSSLASFFLAVQMSPETALAVERTRGLGALVEKFLATRTDRDGDGASRFFGGGDCNDAEPRLHPGAVDVPGNGVDEDCSGGDEKSAAAKPIPEKSPQSAAPAVAVPSDLNVLILTVDTLRYDLGFTRGGPGPSYTPSIDALAKGALVFDRAYSLASYTSKSLSPMFIGRYPSETERTFAHFDRFAPSVPWVAERVQKAGITTASVQGYWYFFNKGYGFERGYDLLKSDAAPKLVAIEGDKTSNGHKIADGVIETLATLEAGKKRFYLWAHWVDPHAEYVPHKEFDFGPKGRQRYDGEVAFVDAQIGRILAALEKSSLGSKTMVLLTSDHGEAFGEHGMYRHGFELWEELVRVPLLVKVPGIPGKHVSVKRSTIDVVPTILDVFGIPQANGETDFVRGTSLLRDAGSGALEERPILVDMPAGPFNSERRAFYSGDHKLITTQGRAIGLFNLATDPLEKTDLSGDEALKARLLGEMKAYLATLRPREATR